MVGTASDGRAAVKLARDLKAGVVLMDLMMPGLDGLAATRRLRALEAPPRVIALSGRLDRLSARGGGRGRRGRVRLEGDGLR